MRFVHSEGVDFGGVRSREHDSPPCAAAYLVQRRPRVMQVLQDLDCHIPVGLHQGDKVVKINPVDRAVEREINKTWLPEFKPQVAAKLAAPGTEVHDYVPL